MMHRQANFYAAFITERRRTFGDGEGQVNTFYFPANEGTSDAGRRQRRRGVPRRARGVGGDAVPRLARVRQRPPDGADRRSTPTSACRASSRPTSTPTRRCGTTLEQVFLEILQTADPVAFDASDLMPGEVGTGTFWSEGVALVNGDVDAQTAADNIEASWPAVRRSRGAPATTGG